MNLVKGHPHMNLIFYAIFDLPTFNQFFPSEKLILDKWYPIFKTYPPTQRWDIICGPPLIEVPLSNYCSQGLTFFVQHHLPVAGPSVEHCEVACLQVHHCEDVPRTLEQVLRPLHISVEVYQVCDQPYLAVFLRDEAWWTDSCFWSISLVEDALPDFSV